MITSINEFKKTLIKEADAIETDTTMVTSNDVLTSTQNTERLNAYNSLLKNYNANKNKFINIIKKDPNTWEKEAIKIYQTELNKSDNKKYNNKYLVYQWEIVKLQKQLLMYEQTLKNKQAQLAQQPSTDQTTPEQAKINADNLKTNQDELKKLQIDVVKMKKIISDKENELKSEIQEDLKEVNSLK